jgi:hypothetical protein
MRKWEPVLISGAPLVPVEPVPGLWAAVKRRWSGPGRAFRLRTIGRVLLAALAFVALDPVIGLLCALVIWVAHLLCDSPEEPPKPRHLRAM